MSWVTRIHDKGGLFVAMLVGLAVRHLKRIGFLERREVHAAVRGTKHLPEEGRGGTALAEEVDEKSSGSESEGASDVTPLT
eukprot:7433832-Lingulodinium_polyedra.AAC.1